VKTQTAPRIGAVLAALLLALAAACTTPPPPVLQPTDQPAAPPAAGQGAGLIGVNPDVASTPNARTKTVTYGPWTVPAATGTAHGEEGMISDALAWGVPKPCTNCYVTSMHATLKYADGRDANTDTGQWLHHIVLSSMGYPDPTCGGTLVGLLGEKFFASGNERTRARFPAGYGYHVGRYDSWNLLYDLMNSTTAPAPVKVEMTFDWVPDTTPGMHPLRPVWLDVGNCGQSAVVAGAGAYQYSRTWTLKRQGKVIGLGGHLHDGGTHLTVRDADTGALLCTSVAGYGGPGYEGPPGHQAAYLSSMSQCLAPDGAHAVGAVTNGERLSITAYYDADLHPQHGDHPVMGIAMVFVSPS
jgi:hypothetical protein